ncbi:hypothetical protein [Photobacterium sp. TY1-4]|uniref:hypothetical protein n=1 Tax=Photobacterium sp. TY1-4 TaxID=2899122 RepID=UPI0021BE5AB7|nr:hypothetical protein [Photobacterium sp. TY1-4]UXI00628.1 hypothetical protein NH461_12540 [Photobacterium sp. TY1-4]
MDRRAFLVISISGLLTITALHLADLWTQQNEGAFHQFLLEWLPLYLVWIGMVLIGGFTRTTSLSKKPPGYRDA